MHTHSTLMNYWQRMLSSIVVTFSERPLYAEVLNYLARKSGTWNMKMSYTTPSYRPELLYDYIASLLQSEDAAIGEWIQTINSKIVSTQFEQILYTTSRCCWRSYDDQRMNLRRV